MTFEVLRFPDARLRQKSLPVVKGDEFAMVVLADKLLQTMYANEGIGLSAPQVGVLKRVVVMDCSPDQTRPRVYINPEILTKSGNVSSFEGCLSIPGFVAQVSRAANIRVEAMTCDLEPFKETLKEKEAICLQHEIDHLDGRLFVDYLSRQQRRAMARRFKTS